MPGATHPFIVTRGCWLASSSHFWDRSGLPCGTNTNFSHKDSRGRILPAVGKNPVSYYLCVISCDIFKFYVRRSLLLIRISSFSHSAKGHSDLSVATVSRSHLSDFSKYSATRNRPQSPLWCPNITVFEKWVIWPASRQHWLHYRKLIDLLHTLNYDRTNKQQHKPTALKREVTKE